MAHGYRPGRYADPTPIKVGQAVFAAWWLGAIMLQAAMVVSEVGPAGLVLVGAEVAVYAAAALVTHVVSRGLLA